MLDVAPTELLLVALVALVVIGPKDLPRAMRFVGQWVARARGVARHFRSGIDEMIRQSELEEMEKKWREENDRIMREFPNLNDPVALPDHSEAAASDAPAMTALPSPDADAPTAESPSSADLANWHGATGSEPPPPVDPPPAAPTGPATGEVQYSLLPEPPAPPVVAPEPDAPEGKPPLP
jgi:sec-independent protein translocase protein TatB